MNINKLKNIVGAMLLLMVFSTFTACDKVEDIDVGGTSVESMSGDWWIVALEPDGVTPAYGGDYVHFSTFNTAADNGDMWITDFGNWFEIKTVVSTNVKNLTFEGEAGAEEAITGGTITISNGVITKNSYQTASNTMVDAIQFEVEIDWAPGTVFIFKGHKRTGFPEDEDPHYTE
jgi:hypothetical protein